MRRPFTMFASRCQAEGCGKKADAFGYCSHHYEYEIRRRHASLTHRNATTPRPPCFDSEWSWMEYQVMSAECVESTAKPLAKPCADCTPQRRDAMIAAGRCNHPETVFVASKTEGLMGFNADDGMRWLEACDGAAGKVISMPTTQARIKAAARLGGGE